jgi:hypothetical protein
MLIVIHKGGEPLDPWPDPYNTFSGVDWKNAEEMPSVVLTHDLASRSILAKFDLVMWEYVYVNILQVVKEVVPFCRFNHPVRPHYL